MIRGVVLVVVDCLRADHVSSYGYERPTTPTLDVLAHQGLSWRNAYSTSSWTKPSVASLFTGLYPSQHGVLRGVKPSKRRTGAVSDVLACPGPTLAEAFSSAGWRCAAFTDNVQFEEYTRFNRGFATYVPAGGEADHLLTLVDEWLSASGAAPFFLYVHFMETHWAYKPRRRHLTLFGGDRDTNAFRDYNARDYGRLRRSLLRRETTLSAEKLRDLIQMYDGAIRRVDGKIKNLLHILETRGLADRAAVAVTADHGEEFLDHGAIGHGQSLYDELTHVPLILRRPDGPRHRRRDHPVSLVDLPRTLLSVAGIEMDFPGCNLTDKSAGSSPVCSELSIRNQYTQALRLDAWKMQECTLLDAGREERPVELLRRAQSEAVPPHRTTELYDLATDPHEQNNLAATPEHAEILSRLMAGLDRWRSALAAGAGDASGGEVVVDEAVIQRLRALGYLE